MKRHNEIILILRGLTQRIEELKELKETLEEEQDAEQCKYLQLCINDTITEINNAQAEYNRLTN